MKKLVSVLMCIVLIAALFTGCKITINVNHNGGAAAPTEASTTAPTTAPSTAAPTTAAPTTAPAPAPGGDDTTTAAPAPGGDDTTAAPAPAPSSNPSTPEEILNVYKEVYKNTKADGSFTGTSHMTCTSVVINGSENSLLRSTADKFMGGDTPDLQLAPETESNPYKECDATVDDITNATWKDNGDGTATLVITPKETVGAMRFTTPAGKFLNVMEDVASALESVPVVSWTEGDANSNTTLTSSGTVEVTYDTTTMKMTHAKYDLVTKADVVHLKVLMFNDIAGTAMFDYLVEYPG